MDKNQVNSDCVYHKQGLALDEYENIYISSNKLEITYDAYSSDSSWFENIIINYCPMCGSKLN